MLSEHGLVLAVRVETPLYHPNRLEGIREAKPVTIHYPLFLTSCATYSRILRWSAPSVAGSRSS